MATASTLPGTLNIALKRGDSLSQPVDFDFDMTGLVLGAEVVTVISGKSAGNLEAAYVDESAGTLVLSMSASDSAAMSPGAYLWRLTWSGPGVERRTGLEGVFEVVR